MTARKTGAGGKTAPSRKKKTSAKKASAAKAPAKKTSAKKPATKKAAAPKGAAKKQAAAPAKPKGGASSTDVHLGHVFALRPRVATSFRPDDFRRAKQLLEDERYPDVAAAARAVAEKALELTHEGASDSRPTKRI